MFDICFGCHQDITSSSSTITPIAQSISAMFAAFAFFWATMTLNRLKNSQALQAQMNIISLENELSKNYNTFKVALREYGKIANNVTNNIDVIASQTVLAQSKADSFEMYISSADKLAALINSDFLQKQFKKRNWKNEYLTKFNQVKTYYDSDESNLPNKSTLINNVNTLLKKWGD